MAESSSQNPSSPEINPKEEPITFDKPESLNPFLPESQVDFTFDAITFTTNNEIPTKNTLRMCQISFPNAVDYAKIIWEDLIHKLNKKTREKIVHYLRFISLLLEHMMPEYDNKDLTINLTLVFSVYNWILKPSQPEEPPFTTHMKAICNLDVPVDSKALKPSSQTEETEASKSKTGQSERDTQSNAARDKSLSHPSPLTPMVGKMHKEAQQAAGGPTSLGATSEEGAHPQLSSGHDALAYSIVEVDPGIYVSKDSIS
ncbi:hypothetical protein Tco_1414568 [Tanacetum coccineum]